MNPNLSVQFQQSPGERLAAGLTRLSGTGETFRVITGSTHTHVKGSSGSRAFVHNATGQVFDPEHTDRRIPSVSAALAEAAEYGVNSYLSAPFENDH